MAIVHDSKEMKKGHLKIIKFCLYNFKHLGSEDRNNFYSESVYLGEVMMSRKNLIVSLLPSHSSKVKKNSLIWGRLVIEEGQRGGKVCEGLKIRM